MIQASDLNYWSCQLPVGQKSEKRKHASPSQLQAACQLQKVSEGNTEVTVNTSAKLRASPYAPQSSLAAASALLLVHVQCAAQMQDMHLSIMT